MTRNSKIIVTILGLAFVILIGYLIWQSYYSNGTAQVPIDNNFGDKIVYTTDTTVDTAPFEQDCRSRGGTFNNCGDTCRPGTEVCASVCALTCENIGDSSSGDSGPISTRDWQEYESPDFGISVRHPKNWQTKIVGETGQEMKLNLSPADLSGYDRGLNHFDNVDQVSIFPEGLGTEGVVGQTAENFDLETDFEVADISRVYVLEDGTPYAALVVPENPPSFWTESGFIWLRAEVEDLELVCRVNGEDISMDDCNPLSANGGQLIRRGNVDKNTWQTELEILKSISFIEAKSGAEKDDLIMVTEPMPEQEISSPLTIKGEARGSWFFEASFPVVLTNWDGLIIAEGIATAQEDWMTEEFVPFTAKLEFDSPYQQNDPDFMQYGSLILQKDNPSGLPEHDDALEFRIKFKPD